MEANFIYLLALSPTVQCKPAQKQQFESKFHISGNLCILSLFIIIAVLLASSSHRIVKFQDFFENKEAKRR